MKLAKYHGLGNDFIIGLFDEMKHLNISKITQSLCHRHSGIGADGLILVKTNPLEMIYYNSDGSRAEMCGNGIRCFANFIYDEKIELKQDYQIKTLAGLYDMHVTSYKPFTCTVDMGISDYKPAAFKGAFENEVIDYPLTLDQQTYKINALLMGVPHTVVIQDHFDLDEIKRIGPKIESHPLFKAKTNVNFVEVINDNHIKMQTFERGAGLTLACGTGACATFDVLHKKGLIQDQVTIDLPLGQLQMSKLNGHVLMTGPAEKIADIILPKELS